MIHGSFTLMARASLSGGIIADRYLFGIAVNGNLTSYTLGKVVGGPTRPWRSFRERTRTA